MATPDRTINELNSVVETERILGISHGTLYKFLKEGKIQSAALGRKRVFTRRHIETFIASLENGCIGEEIVSEPALQEVS